jgi:glyoxylase-like metal-dependent hydrolase (beta-lactamase superfamily II)
MNEVLKNQQLKPIAIVNTHLHIDHIFGIDYMKKYYKTELWANEKDSYLLDNAQQTAKMFGFEFEQIPVIDKSISEKDEIKFGNSVLKILEVPGHTLGHLAFYSEIDKFVMTGDVLFKDTIGRTDLPGGDLDTLLNSIRTKLLTLGDDYTVFPGHGLSTNIGVEKRENPFL